MLNNLQSLYVVFILLPYVIIFIYVNDNMFGSVNATVVGSIPTQGKELLFNFHSLALVPKPKLGAALRVEFPYSTRSSSKCRRKLGNGFF